MLERHKLESEQLWMEKVPEEFSFVESNSRQMIVETQHLFPGLLQIGQTFGMLCSGGLFTSLCI